MALKSKKHNTQSEWVDAYNDAFNKPDRIRAEELIETAINRLPKNAKCVYGWSGGKDAIVLQLICELAGIDDCVLGTIGERWEYPCFIDYVKNNKPRNLTIKDFNITADFLNKNEHLVFPQTAKDNYVWYQKCNQRAYYEFAKDKNADFILLGHRSLDGNDVKSTKNGKVFPIYDFTHEDIFCILSYYQKQLPNIYFYKDGFFQGTHAWIMRAGKNAMDDLYNIDKTILLKNNDVNKIKNYLIVKGDLK